MRWSSVLGYDGRYSVSDEGDVRSDARVIVRRNGSPMTVRERLLKPAVDTTGYLVVALSRGGSIKKHYVHALVAEAFCGDRGDGQQCRHLNGNRADNRATNLEWGSPSENANDRWAHGTMLFGEDVHFAKLSESEVLEILRVGRSLPQKEVASRYGVSQSLISAILLGKRWGHLEAAR